MMCKINGCINKVFGHGLCSKHYNRQRRHGSTEMPLTRRGQMVLEGRSHCPKCGQEKSLDEFLKDKHTRYGISIYCRECHRNKAKARYYKNPDYYKEACLQKDFGISLKQYRQMEERQDGRCDICGKKRGSRCLAVDHDHKTGKNRGLLCDRCNLGLGWFRDSVPLLEYAIQYLKKHS